MTRDSYIAIGWRLAIPVAVITFIACWIYAFFEYGFLLGVGLGWFPSLLVALVAGGLTIFLWGLVPVAVVAGVAIVVLSGRPAEVDAALAEEEAEAAVLQSLGEADPLRPPTPYELEQERLRKQYLGEPTSRQPPSPQ